MKPIIICVDDEEIILKSLRSEIKEHFGKDYTIELASSGKEALELLDELLEEEEEVALVISDYLMPEMNGDELLVHIHTQSPMATKVMLSGQANQAGITLAKEEGGLHCFVQKPWNPQSLMKVISEALNEYKTKAAKG